MSRTRSRRWRRQRPSASCRRAPWTCASPRCAARSSSWSAGSPWLTTATTPTPCRCAPPSSTSPPRPPSGAWPCSARWPSSARTPSASIARSAGPDAERFHREIGGLADELGIDVLITVGEAALPIGSAYGGERYAAATPEEAGALLEELAREGDRVLVKGSRSAGLERVLTAR